MNYVATRRRSGVVRSSAWVAAGAMLAVALLAPSTVFAAGPGNNGLDSTGNGTTSNAKVGGSLSAAGNSATMNADAVLACSGTNAGSVTGSFTLTKDLDAGSTITIYLVPNNGSNANPEGNVSRNETTVTLTDADNSSGSVIGWTVNVTSPFTVSSGGILGVFAVNADGRTAISSSKTNSLNCTESSPSAPPSSPPSAPPSTP